MFRRFVLAIGVVVIALLGYAVKLVAFPSPEDTVQRFFDAVADRDLSRAAEETLADFSGETVWSTMWRMMSSEHYQPPTGVRTGGWQDAPAAEGERVVAVQYELGGVTHSSLLKLRREGKWRIVNGTGTIEVNISNALINGQALGASRRLTLLPGIYQVSTNADAPLLRASPVEVAVTPDRKATARLATALTADATAKVKQNLDAIIKACETAGATQHDCPYKSIDVSGLSQVKWTLISLPELTIEQSGPDSVMVKGSGQGSVRLNAVDAAGQGIDRVDSFSINGKCVENSAFVSCTFTA